VAVRAVTSGPPDAPAVLSIGLTTKKMMRPATAASTSISAPRITSFLSKLNGEAALVPSPSRSRLNWTFTTLTWSPR